VSEGASRTTAAAAAAEGGGGGGGGGQTSHDDFDPRWQTSMSPPALGSHPQKIERKNGKNIGLTVTSSERACNGQCPSRGKCFPGQKKEAVKLGIRSNFL
jgi:hypothetical protein